MVSLMSCFSLQFAVSSYAVRTANIQNDEDLKSFVLGNLCLDGHLKAPKPQNIPMMVARRLCTGTRLAVDVALEMLKDETIDGCVFSSRHGELERNSNILNALSSGLDVSPTDFTMSVHNSAVANAVITAKRQIATSSIAAGSDTFISGLIEAYTFLKSGARKVLLVDFDGSIPDCYQHYVPLDVKDLPYAAAFVLEEGSAINLKSRLLTDTEKQDCRNAQYNVVQEHEALCSYKSNFPSNIQSVDFASKLLLNEEKIEIAGERNMFEFTLAS